MGEIDQAYIKKLEDIKSKTKDPEFKENLSKKIDTLKGDKIVQK